MKIIFSLCLIFLFLGWGEAWRLHRLITQNRCDRLKDVIESGEAGSIDQIGQQGQTPLMHAVLQGNVECVKVLLELGANPEIGEKDGYTPMHGAGFQGRAEVAKLLINKGLDPDPVHEDGYTPLARACWGNEQRHTDTAKVLLEAGADLAKVDRVPTNPMTKKLIEEWIEEDDKYIEEMCG
eukprot:CAMPEP_0201524030 /NCGR_PEP_ID=MMETSP0161_2-20130828/21071_1 /ASSEMBLY_ACC=CAM_ASM_000251 /TAXON_ID=180227 /ORGANISM="Neoparamoeba aestuarina, Strain SoJaBio B1-5/56/2" /LENGTH=180 /DNA_ID=CAMNT_0047923289 /DNA_START=93 /DNA_END=635 /DNA_ORIENTATION=+